MISHFIMQKSIFIICHIANTIEVCLKISMATNKFLRYKNKYKLLIYIFAYFIYYNIILDFFISHIPVKTSFILWKA